MDIMYLDSKPKSKPVLHIVDEGTKFSAAVILPDISTSTVWETILTCWANIYTGLPNRVLVDQGTNFGNTFVQIAFIADVDANETGIEAH